MAKVDGNISDIRVGSVSQDSSTSYGNTVALSWRDAVGMRYHVWMNKQDDGTYKPAGVIYKNPPLNISRHDEGWFHTRHMRLDGDHGSVMLPAALTAFPALLEQALKAKAQSLEWEAAGSRASALKNRKEERAERMYDLLFAMRTIIPPSHPLSTELKAIIAEVEASS